MDYDSTVEFFVDSLYAWADKVQLTAQGDYYLLGHSFGGYIAAEYAMKHPENIKKLIMMSPIGMPKPPDSSRLPREEYGLMARVGHDWIINNWENGSFSAFDTARIIGGSLTKPIINWSIQRRMNLRDEKEKEALATYIHQIMMRKKSSEVAITQVLAFRAYARRPLSDRLHLLQMPVTFMHGEYDWVTRETADKLIADKKVVGRVFTVPYGGHHLYIENAKGCVADLISFTHDQATSD